MAPPAGGVVVSDHTWEVVTKVNIGGAERVTLDRIRVDGGWLYRTTRYNSVKTPHPSGRPDYVDAVVAAVAMVFVPLAGGAP